MGFTPAPLIQKQAEKYEKSHIKGSEHPGTFWRQTWKKILKNALKGPSILDCPGNILIKGLGKEQVICRVTEPRHEQQQCGQNNEDVYKRQNMDDALTFYMRVRNVYADSVVNAYINGEKIATKKARKFLPAEMVNFNIKKEVLEKYPNGKIEFIVEPKEAKKWKLM